MVRLRKIFPLILLIAAPFVLYQFFSYFARKPLNDALIEAVKKDNLAQVELLLARGADINSGDNTRYTSCTDFNPPRTGNTPLILSISRMPFTKLDAALMNLLLKRGANPNIGNTQSRTPLHFAASLGHLPAVQALLSHGADVNVKDSTEDTPLTEAAYRNNIEVVKLLLAHGADVNAKGQLGFSALARTTGYRNNIAIMKLLITHGADVNTRNKLGKTPLHGAADYGRTEAMQILLQHGADPNAKDKKGQTPLTVAAGYGSKPIYKWQNTTRDEMMQRQAFMTKLLTNASASN